MPHCSIPLSWTLDTSDKVAMGTTRFYRRPKINWATAAAIVSMRGSALAIWFDGNRVSNIAHF